MSEQRQSATPRTSALIDSAVNDDAALLHAHMAFCVLERENIALLQALEEIYAGNTMQGTGVFTHADVIQRHYQIARAALAKAKGLT